MYVYRSTKICDHQRSSSMRRALKTSSYSESLLLSSSSCRWGHRNYASAFYMCLFWYWNMAYVDIFSPPPPAPLQCVVYVLFSHTTYCAAIDKLEILCIPLWSSSNTLCEQTNQKSEDFNVCCAFPSTTRNNITTSKTQQQQQYVGKCNWETGNVCVSVCVCGTLLNP